ncbi:MAG: translation initiation factor IF-2 [Candidatus Zambryskibacteria bacterium]|nr:translation initiation factor IF-2 [Candidatus Zambryskibacteria bacterium]
MTKETLQNNTTPRPPVVGIFGHIDHGKSTLIDYIRKSNVTATEAGGITQHISAYEVMHKRDDGRESKITFLDTPGHEAFSSIRTRGANVADIAVLVVSGEDGVKPQTLEVFKYIQESKLPYLVAITKMDKPTADLPRIKQSLAENGIYVEGYGGNVSAIPLSSKTGQGVPELLDMVSLTAELLELTAEVETLGTGVIIESRLDPKRGITAVGIIKNGTISKGTFAAAGGAMTPIRFLLDAEGNTVEELSTSSPVQIIGWDKLPKIGSEFKTFLKKDDALAYLRSEVKDTRSTKAGAMVRNAIALPLILKADTAGSLEAIENEIAKLSRERMVPKVILASVGSINESDVKGALSGTGAVILGFNTKVDSGAAALAERSNISISIFNIIYELTEKVSKLLEEREPRIEVEETLGTAKVLKLFSTSKGKQVLGARVISGKISLGTNIKIIRRETEIGKGKVKEIQQAKVATGEALEGSEFGAMIESKFEIAPGDVLEAVVMVTK